MRTTSISLLALVVCLPHLVHAKTDKICILRNEGKDFDEVAGIISSELVEKYEISEIKISQKSTYNGIKSKLTESSPDLLVLMDNKPLEYALKFNSELTDPRKKIRGVALMSLNLKKRLKGNAEISGIAYEPSPYLLVTQFRYIVGVPIKKVAAFYRNSLFHDAIEEVKDQLKGEGVLLEPVNVEEIGTSRTAISEFMKKRVGPLTNDSGKSDALWILLDSMIINQDLFNSVWIPAARSASIPFITSAENLVAPEMHFGTFAITPNLPDMANQAVQQIEGILHDNIPPSSFGVEEVVSVNKILNRQRAKEINLKLREDRLGEIKILE